jgi:nitric oxide reductase NorQ protein
MTAECVRFKFMTPVILVKAAKESLQCKINCTVKISACAGMTERDVFLLFSRPSIMLKRPFQSGLSSLTWKRDMKSATKAIEEYRIEKEPYYLSTSNEVKVFSQAYSKQLPMLLKGPTGCGKTRFVEYMAWRLGRPLVIVACHDDLTAGDLVGRYLIQGSDTVWTDGPLTRAVRAGALCYLDEIVEARKDTTVVIHPLADDRRILPIEKRGEILAAPPEFMLIISYNPGYQSIMKDLKPSTRQRFVSLAFNYPEEGAETAIVVKESGVDQDLAKRLVKLGQMTRNLKERGLDEGASTRLLIHAGKLIRSGIDAREACRAAITNTLSDDEEMQISISEMISSLF